MGKAGGFGKTPKGTDWITGRQVPTKPAFTLLGKREVDAAATGCLMTLAVLPFAVALGLLRGRR